jgi:serine/threonine-protein kinase
VEPPPSSFSSQRDDAGDEVALKVLRKDNKDPDAVERLFREAQAMTQMSGTTAVRVLNQLRTEDGSFCLVMELLHGRDLAAHLDDLDATNQRMSVPEIVATFEPLVRTLEVAREKNIVHRDLKPENIFMIDPAWGGGVRLLDFGFAKQKSARPLTAAGVVAGSPSYLAPEVWRGGADIDHLADVYAFGVILFRIVGGKLPFTGAMHELFRAVTTAPRPSLHALRPDLPPAIDDWVAHALAIDRAQRFQRVTALWNALLVCLRG